MINHYDCLYHAFRHTCSFAYVLKYVILFWMIKWMMDMNNFQIAKVQPQGVAWQLLDFLPVSAWCCL